MPTQGSKQKAKDVQTRGPDGRPKPAITKENITVSILIGRLQSEREHLFKAIAIVELCRLATAPLLEASDSECMTPALETTCDLLNASAERLEWISSDLRKLCRKDQP